MKESKNNKYTEALTLYDLLISVNPSLERKGKTMPYTSVNGHMYSFLSKEGVMGLRLSKIDLDEFLLKFKSKLMIQHGRTMKEYVEVPPDVLKNTKVLTTYIKLSYTYVSGLKPKVTKKKAN